MMNTRLKILKITALLTLTFLLGNLCIAQENSHPTGKERDSILAIDYINYKYKFINRDFSLRKKEILNDSALKQQLSLKKTSYKDSLYTILKYELKSDFMSHNALNRILQKWDIASYYLWLTEKECIEIAKEFDMDHPYLFYAFLINDKKDLKRDKLLKTAKEKAEKELGIEISYKDRKDLTNQLFRLNPIRMKAQREYIKKYSK